MDSLVSTDWLAAHIGEPDLVIVDATKHLATAGRDGAAEFLDAHIAGARFLNLESLNDPASRVGKTLPGPMQATMVLGALGITPEDRIVLYDNSDVKTSARAWFILRGYGFDKVAILDGGFSKWKAEGRSVESGMADVETGLVPLGDFTRPVRRKADLIANLDSHAEQVVDARDAGRFTGATVDTVHNLPGGHIPGARNLFFCDLYEADGTFKPRADLQAAFEQAGVDLARPIVTSCGSGVTASVLLFVLHLLGRDDAALYDGSWSEWGADPATPKQTGTA